MFSGIVEELGTIHSITDTADGRRLRISAKIVTADLKLGDSVSVNGCCLTATAFGSDWFDVECTLQTLRCTKLGVLKRSDRVNLERALKLSDRLGGHLVTGHVDGLGKVCSIEQDGFSKLITFEVSSEFAPFFVEKGSVTVDGVSLTVAALPPSGSACLFTVALIPHTMEVTSLGALKVGDQVNIETDVIGKYAARWLQPFAGDGGNVKNARLSQAFLAEHGYT